MADDNTVLDLLRKTDRGRLLFETSKQVRDLGPELMSRLSEIMYVVGAVTKYDEAVRRCAKDIAASTGSARHLLREILAAHRFGYVLGMFDDDALPVPHMLEEDFRLAAEAVVSNVERFHAFDDTPPPFFRALNIYRTCCRRIEAYVEGFANTRFSTDAQQAINAYKTASSVPGQLRQT